jgi:hypothetical protein
MQSLINMFSKKQPSSLVRRVGGKLYINLCKASPRWTCIALDGFISIIINTMSTQENGYSITIMFKDDREISLAPQDHMMGFSLDEANEIVFAV